MDQINALKLSFLTDFNAVDPKQLPWLHISGTVLDVLDDNSFKLTIHQYCGLKQANIEFPVLAVIPDSPKYRDGKKPMPTAGRIVSFGGVMTGVQVDANEAQLFIVEIASIAFLGKTTLQPKTPTAAPGEVHSQYSQ